MSLLFESRRVAQLEVKNRLMRSATAERLVDKSGAVTDDLVALYKRLAQSEVGTIITGYTSIHPRGRSGWQMMSIDNDDFIKGLQRLTKAVHEYEARILVQLCHSGRYAPSILILAAPKFFSKSTKIFSTLSNNSLALFTSARCKEKITLFESCKTKLAKPIILLLSRPRCS